MTQIPSIGKGMYAFEQGPYRSLLPWDHNGSEMVARFWQVAPILVALWGFMI